MKNRVFNLEGVSNFRDFGGYANIDGRKVQQDRLFRSGTFNRPSVADMARLDQLNIEIISDLRRTPEREKEPSIWPRSDQTKIISGPSHLQLTAEQPTFITFLGKPRINPDETRAFAIEAFQKIVFDPLYLHLFGQTLQAITQTEGAVIIHCTHGKDRTGILCGLILQILGVPESTILEDFELTNAAIDLENSLPAAHDAFEKRYGIDVPLDVLKPMLGVHPDYLSAAFDSMRSQCGSIEHYLEKIGMDQSRRAIICSNYLVDS
jgi:protein-tyrosine phosphatase